MVTAEDIQTTKHTQATSKQQTSMTHVNSVTRTINVTQGGGTHIRWYYTVSNESREIPKVLNDLFAEQCITSKQHLDDWCGNEKRKKLYNYVKSKAPEHWNKLKVPESRVRNHYEIILTGFKISKQ